MRKTTLTVALLGAGLGLAIFAQDDQQHSAWMKASNKEVGQIRKMLDAKTAGPENAPGAKKLIGIYQDVEKFWTQRNTEDAVKWAKEAQGAAGELAAALEAGKTDDANQVFGRLNGTCKSCHSAHRERLPDGSFKIK